MTLGIGLTFLDALCFSNCLIISKTMSSKDGVLGLAGSSFYSSSVFSSVLASSSFFLVESISSTYLKAGEKIMPLSSSEN